jgi:hypothetical protein
VLVLLAGAGQRSQAALPQSARLDVTLEDAVWPVDDPSVPKPLRVKLERTGGQWERLVMADARRLQFGDHWGALTNVDISDAGGTFSVVLRIDPDPWSKTFGHADYQVALKRSEDGGLSGTWEGRFNGQACKGAARAIVWPLVGSPRSDHRPRFLFRKDQLPALKAKAQTPWGKTWIARLEAAIASDPEPTGRALGHGVMYQLTGDKARAVAARQLLEKDVPNWNNVMYVHGAAARVVLAALAFDLIADGCDEVLGQRLREVFRRKCEYLYYPPVGGFNPNDGSNWSVMYRSALGLAALSCLAQPGKAPEAPMNEGILDLAPAAADGSPAVALEAGKSISAWRYNGPVDVPWGVDALTIAPPKQQSVPLDARHFITQKQAENYRNPKLLGGVDFASVTGRRYFTSNELSTVLTVDKAGAYGIEFSDTKMEQIIVWLAGKRLASGDVVRLRPGRYPLKVLASVGVVGNWEMIEWYLRFNALTDEEAQAWERDRRGVAQLIATLRGLLGKDADIEAMRWLGVSRQRVSNWAQTALGENGWNLEGEAYTQHSLRCVLPLEQAHRNATGRSVFIDERVGRMFALSAAKTVFGEDRVTMPSYGPGGGPLGVDNWGRGMGLIPPAQRGAAMWAWNRSLKLAEAGKFKMTELLVDKLDALAAAGAFVHGSLDDAEADPAQTLPRVLVDKKKGGYVFRNRWQDGDDFVVSYFLDSDPDGGGWRAPDWTDFRISGLGVDWAVRGIAWGNGASARTLPNPRLYGNVLYVPDAWRREKSGAATTHFASAPDGSGTVTANLDNVYLGAAPDGRKSADVGVRGTRSLAVDYSGAGGSPCLVAVADQVSGTKGQNVWQFCTMAEHEVTVQPTGFVVKAANGATLVATVIQPAGPKIAVAPVTIRHENNYHGKHSQSDMKRKVVSVPGGESFFVVMTVQKGAPPEVKAENGRATVGKRSLKLDGPRIVLE